MHLCGGRDLNIIYILIIFRIYNKNCNEMPISGQFGCNLHVLAERTVYVKYESCRIEHVRKLQTDRPETTHPDHWIRWYMYENNIK